MKLLLSFILQKVEGSGFPVTFIVLLLTDRMNKYLLNTYYGTGLEGRRVNNTRVPALMTFIDLYKKKIK